MILLVVIVSGSTNNGELTDGFYLNANNASSNANANISTGEFCNISIYLAEGKIFTGIYIYMYNLT